MFDAAAAATTPCPTMHARSSSSNSSISRLFAMMQQQQQQHNTNSSNNNNAKPPLGPGPLYPNHLGGPGLHQAPPNGGGNLSGVGNTNFMGNGKRISVQGLGLIATHCQVSNISCQGALSFTILIYLFPTSRKCSAQ